MYKSKKLLNIDNNAKTIKGQKLKVKTAILYLAPANESGFNMCPMASAGCKAACLFTAGRGKFNNVRQGRINKTIYFMKDRENFLKQLIKEEFKKSLWWGPPEGSGRPSHERTVEDQLGDLKQQLKTLAARVEALENPNRKEEEDIFEPPWAGRD